MLRRISPHSDGFSMISSQNPCRAKRRRAGGKSPHSDSFSMIPSHPPSGEASAEQAREACMPGTHFPHSGRKLDICCTLFSCSVAHPLRYGKKTEPQHTSAPCGFKTASAFPCAATLISAPGRDPVILRASPPFRSRSGRASGIMLCAGSESRHGENTPSCGQPSFRRPSPRHFSQSTKISRTLRLLLPTV